MLRLLACWLAAGCLAFAARAQETPPGLGGERRWQGPAEAVIQLPDAPLDPSSLVVGVENRRLREGVDWRADPLRGRVHLLQTGLLGRPAWVRYRVLRLDLPAELALRPRESLPWVGSGRDSLARDSLSGARLPDREELDGSRLVASGSFLRGVRVGSGGQVGMESGLRLQVEGQIGPDVEVQAFLTDRNTPIQPEGRSQNLEEIDRIHVQVRSPRWQARLGDIDLALKSGAYLDLSRTVDGVQAGYDHDGTRLLAHLAAARGRFRRMEWTGQEGVQGPWQLRTEQGGDQILVLAGSERVWLDGVELTRGEDRDYVMDYALAQLSFTPRRPITGESRLAVEFQYAERVFLRSLYGFDARLEPRPNLSLRLGLAGERDDGERPLDLFLDDEDRDLLAAAGDGGGAAVAAWGSGVRRVEDGEGSYRLVDSLAGRWGRFDWAEEPLEDPLFRYELRFTELGRDPSGALLGDYSRQISSSGRIWYRFEGEGGGAWAPIIPLTAPTAHEVLDGSLAYSAGAWRMEGEAALSRRDLNLFSSRDDEDNLGAALRGALRWTSRPWPADRPLGRWEGEGRLQQEQADFRTLHPVDEVEFTRLFGLERDGGLRRHDLNWGLRGGDSLRLAAAGSWLSRADERSRLLEGRWRWRPLRGAFLEGEGKSRHREGGSTDRLEGLRAEQGWTGGGRVWTTAWEGERRRSGAATTDGRQWRQGLARLDQRWDGLEGSVERLRRVDERSVADHWGRLSQADQWRTRLRRGGGWQGELDWTHRRLDHAGPDSVDQVRDVALLDARGGGGGRFWNLRYQAENSLAAERLVQYVRVDSLQGDYSRDPFNPDLFVPDPDGDYLALPFETGRQRKAARLFLEGNVRWEAGPWSGDHQLLAEEESRLADPARLYMLQPAAFLSDSTDRARLRTRHEAELSEETWTGSTRRWRLRLSEERGLERPLPGSLRRSLQRRIALRLQERVGGWRTSLEGEWRGQGTDMPGQPQDERRVRAWRLAVEGSRDLAPGWLLRLSAEGERAREERQRIAGRRLRLEPVLDARLGRRGSAAARLSWQQAWADEARIPYELLGGARVGRTWRAGLEGRLQTGRQTRVTLSWQVDALPERQPQHTGRLTVQSFF
jgi:hypothetical protein